MAETREQCAICLRERATDADWERNGELNMRGLSVPVEEAEAERMGLTKLCWEQEDDGCTGCAIDQGRPLSYLEAMERISELEAAASTQPSSPTEEAMDRAEGQGRR